MIDWDIEIENATREEFREIVDEVETTMKSEAPSDTGNLRNSIHSEKENDFEYFVGVDGSQLSRKNGFDYSSAIVNGRREVRPVNKKALKFVVNGQTVFTKKAKATQPNDFVARTVAKFR